MKTWRQSSTLIAIFFLTSIVSSAVADDVPLIVPYTGTVASGGEPVNGSGTFKFAIVDQDCQPDGTESKCTTLWSLDGSSTKGSEPNLGLSVEIFDGQFQVKLGDSGLKLDNGTSDMKALSADLFTTTNTYLRIWFDDGVTGFEQLTPDRQLLSVPYAMHTQSANTALGVAADSIGSAQIKSSEVQQRVAGSCPSGEAITSIAENGAPTCVAVSSGGEGSVTTIQIVNNAITSEKIDTGAVQSAQIGDESVTTTDIANGTITDSDISNDTTITATDFNYTTPKTRYMSFHPGAMNPKYNTVEADFYMGNGYTYARTASTAIYLAAPVHLPDGAIVTEARCTYRDGTGAANLTAFTIYYRAVNMNSGSLASLASTSASSFVRDGTLQHVSDTTIGTTGNPVDNSLYAYHIFAYMNVDATGSDVRFHGCRLTYTVDKVNF